MANTNYSIMDLSQKITAGKYLKKGLIFRSGNLSSLTSAEISFLNNLHLKTILDLRTEQEALGAPDPMIDGTEYIRISAIPDNVQRTVYETSTCSTGKSGENCSDRRSTAFNEAIVFSNPAFQKMFDLLLAEKTPMLIHCGTGIDLSGTASMLLALSLGASRRQALSYYTNYKAVSQPNESSIKRAFYSFLNLQSMQDSLHHKMAENQLQVIINKYGTTDNFLSHEYSLNSDKIDHLQELYLDIIDNNLPVENPNELARIHCIIEGHVQGVGFRAFACDKAAEYHITGSVTNLDSGNVEIYAQGLPADINSFLNEIREGNHFVRVHNIRTYSVPVVDEENSFIYERSSADF